MTLRNSDPLALIAAVVRIVGVNADTLWGWRKHAVIDAGSRWQHARSSRGARPATAEVVQFIDDYRYRSGVATICRVLTEHGVPIVSSGLLRDKELARVRANPAGLGVNVQIEPDRKLGRGISGPRKIWRLLQRV